MAKATSSCYQRSKRTSQHIAEAFGHGFALIVSMHDPLRYGRHPPRTYPARNSQMGVAAFVFCVVFYGSNP